MPFLEEDGPGTANDLTITAWDPVSKQPQLKVCGAWIEGIGPGFGPTAPTGLVRREVV